MSRLVRIDCHPHGPRLFVLGRRQHHGRTGLALAVAGAWRRNLSLTLAGLLLCAHDHHDFPWGAR